MTWKWSIFRKPATRVVEFICLANSRKHAGRCVAGIRTDGRGWIRPVSPEKEGILFERHYTLTDRSWPCVLDVLKVKVIGPHPEPHHPENWVISPVPWELTSRPATAGHLNVLRSSVEDGPELLGNQFDRIEFIIFSQASTRASLALVRPANLKWRIIENRKGMRQTLACFKVGGAQYDLSLTDPVWEEQLGGLPKGTYPMTAAGIKPDADVLLTVSLSEPFQDGCCYKLVAGVIILPPAIAAGI